MAGIFIGFSQRRKWEQLLFVSTAHWGWRPILNGPQQSWNGIKFNWMVWIRLKLYFSSTSECKFNIMNKGLINIVRELGPKQYKISISAFVFCICYLTEYT